MNKKSAIVAHFDQDFLHYRLPFVKFLESKKFSIHSFVPKGKEWENIKSLNINITPFTYHRNWSFVFYIFSTRRILRHHFKKTKFDILFTYKFYPNLVAIPIAKKHGIKRIVATIAGLGFLLKAENSIFYKVLAKWYLNVLSMADYLVVQNEDDLKFLRERLPKSKFILTHGSGLDRKELNGTEINKIHALKDQINHDTVQIYILFSSRIVKEKGILELLNAFGNHQKSRSVSKLNLLVAGWFDEPGLEKYALKQMKKVKNLTYLGHQDNIAALISLCDIMVLPSYYSEGIPRSLIEGLAMAKPLITTDHRGCRETIEDNRNGFLVTPRSINDLLAIFEQLEGMEKDELSRMGIVSRQIFNEKFEQKIVFQKILKDAIEV